MPNTLVGVVESFIALGTASVTVGGTTAPAAGTVETWTVASATQLPAANSAGTPPTGFYIADTSASTEVIAVTNISGTTLTVIRGADGTTPVPHVNSFTVIQVATGATYTALQIPWMVDPSNDTTGVKDSALIAGLLSTYGFVWLTDNDATYYLSAPIASGTGNMILGSGRGTVIKPGSAFSGTALIQLANTTVQDVTIRDLTLNGTYLAGVAGVSFNPVNVGDCNYVLENVAARNMALDGFNFTGTGSIATKLNACQAFGNLGNGFTVGPDGQLTNCEAGENMGHGYVLATNAAISISKAWYSGFNAQNGNWTSGSTTSCGFVVLTGASFIEITGCTSQQNALHGYLINGTSGSPCRFCTITGCEADTNSAGNLVTTGNGIELSYALNCAITGNVGWNNAALSPGAQLYGIEVTGNGNGTAISANRVAGSSLAVNYLSSPAGYTVNNTFAQPSTTTFTVTAAVATQISTPMTIGANDATATTTYRLTVYGQGTQGSTAQTLSFSDNLSGLTLTFPSSFVGISTGFSWKCIIEYTFSATGSSGNAHISIWAAAAGSSQIQTKNTQVVNTTINQNIQLNAAWGSVTGTPTVNSFNAVSERMGI